MLKRIVIKDEEKLFTSKVDQVLFERKYPQLFDKVKAEFSGMDRWEIEEIIPETDRIEELISKEEAVLLFFDDETVTPIYNTELIKFNGLETDGCSLFADSRFVYFAISIAGGQAGSLGIWSIATKDWTFTHQDDGLCVAAIIYLPELDSFLGLAEWYQYENPPSGEFFSLLILTDTIQCFA
jgi:hypothetical protein